MRKIQKQKIFKLFNMQYHKNAKKGKKIIKKATG